jgi:SAM-dependent methyltransferase
VFEVFTVFWSIELPGPDDVIRTEVMQRPDSAVGLLVVIHVKEGAIAESVDSFSRQTPGASTPPEKDQCRQIWFVIRDASQPRGSMQVRNQKSVAATNVSLHELLIGPGWGWGAIQKLFFRKAVCEHFIALLTIASETPPGAAIELLLRQSEHAHKAEQPQVVSLTSRPVAAGSHSDTVILARRYQSTFLARVPFDFNNDGEAFEDDVMRQREHLSVAHESRTMQTPTRCPGFPKPHAVLRRIENLRFRLHSLGIWCSLKYRDLSPARYRDKSEKAYSSHSLAIDEIRRAGVMNVLDLGCGPGHVARKCRDMGVVVHGVDLEPPVPDSVSQFTRCNLDQGPYPFDIWSYDAVLLLDLIEHLSAPEDFLTDLRHSCQFSQMHRDSSANRRPLIILTTPNVAFASIRLGLLMGRFNYADRGILDMTHRRLFTRGSLITALENSGYDIETVRPVPAPFSAILPGVSGSVLNRLAALAAWLCPSWFAFQWLIRCRPKPGLGHMASQTRGDQSESIISNS